MLISIMLNGKKVVDDISPDMTLFKFLRAHGCYSVKWAVRQRTVACVLYF